MQAVTPEAEKSCCCGEKMMEIKRAPRNILAVVICFGLLCGCGPKPAAAPAVEPAAPQASATVALLPSSSPALTPTAEAAPTSTRTATSTPSPSATPAPSASPTPAASGLRPGMYDASGCTEWSSANRFTINWCVEGMEVLDDGYIQVGMSWTLTFLIYGITSVTKLSDAGNKNMFMRDDLGNRYNQVNSGRAASNKTKFELNQPIYGWFLFPPAAAGASSFAFNDQDLHIAIENLDMDKIVFTREKLPLKWYPGFTLVYRSDRWQAAQTEEGAGKISYNLIPECQIVEWQPSPVQGQFKNNMAYGDITYDIYGWFEQNTSIREYLAVSGLDGIDQQNQPFFHLTIPLDQKEACINEASEILAGLRMVQPECIHRIMAGGNPPEMPPARMINSCVQVI